MNQNQKTGRNYAEVGQSGSDNQRWEPQKNIGNTQYPTQIEGYFKKFTELHGKNPGTTFYVAEIQMVNQDGSLGQCIDVSGGKVLEEKLRAISLGNFIMIQFKGKVQGKLNTYNDWATFIDEGAIPLHQLMGVSAQSQPFQQQNTQVAQPKVQQQAQNPFGNAPVQNNSAPAVNQQNSANPFSQGQSAQNNQAAPVFNQQQQSNTFVNNQQGGGQMPGVSPGTNPFAQQDEDLPF